MEICLLLGSPQTSPSVHCNVPFSPPKHKLAQALAGALWQDRSQREDCPQWANAGALNKYQDFRVRNFLEPDNAAKNEVANSCAGTLLGTFWHALEFGSVFLKLADTSGLLLDYTHEWAEQKFGV